MFNSRLPAPHRVLAVGFLALAALVLASTALLFAPASATRAANEVTTLRNIEVAPAMSAALRPSHLSLVRAMGDAPAPVVVAQAAAPDQAGGQISGQIVNNGAPVAGTTVTLRRYNADNDDVAVITATTTITGYFAFANPPTPPTGYTYYVEFGPQTNPAYVRFWDSQDISGYTAGQRASVGALNVANVSLVSPPDNATVSFPVTFRWTRRASTTDTYRLALVQPNGSTLATGTLGYVDSVTINQQSALQPGTPYQWGVVVVDSTGTSGFGLSQLRTITFSAAATTTPTGAAGTPVGTTTATTTVTPPTGTAGTPVGTVTAAATTTPTGTAGTPVGTVTAAATTTPTGTAGTPAVTTTPTTGATATGTATTAPATTTATATTVPATATGTATATTVPATTTATATGTATATVPPTVTRTATPVPPTVTRTVTPTPTAAPFTCGGGNLCAGILVVRSFIDFGCDGFFNRGTDFPLFGTTVTATLPDGSTRVAIVDENGNAVISGLNLAAGQTVQLSVDNPSAPTWVQQSGSVLEPCPTSPSVMTISREMFTTFGVAYADFRFTLAQP